MGDLEKLIVEHYTAKFELEISLLKQKCADINCQAQIKNKSQLNKTRTRTRKRNNKLLRQALKKVHSQTERLQLAQRVIDNGLIHTTIMLAKQLRLLPGVQKAAKQSLKIFLLMFDFCKSLPISKDGTKYLAALAFDQILRKIRYNDIGYVIHNSVPQEKIVLALMDVVRNSLSNNVDVKSKKEHGHKQKNSIMFSPLSCPSSLSFSPQASPNQILFSPISISCQSSISFSPLSIPTTPSSTMSPLLIQQSTSQLISPSKLSGLAIQQKSMGRRRQRTEIYTESDCQPTDVDTESEYQPIDTDSEIEYQPRGSKDITIERTLRKSIFHERHSQPFSRSLVLDVEENQTTSHRFAHPPSRSKDITIERTLSKPILRERNFQLFSSSPTRPIPGSPAKHIISSFVERRLSKSLAFEKDIKENTNLHKKNTHPLSRSSTCFIPGSSFHRSAGPLACLEDQKQQKSKDKKHQQRQQEGKKLRNQKLPILKFLSPFGGPIYLQDKEKKQKDNNDHKSVFLYQNSLAAAVPGLKSYRSQSVFEDNRTIFAKNGK